MISALFVAALLAQGGAQKGPAQFPTAPARAQSKQPPPAQKGVTAQPQLPDPNQAVPEAPPPRSSQTKPVLSSAPPKNAPLAGAELDAKTNEVASLLRCPVCQGLSVADSPAGMARDMKAQVKEKLAEGYDRDQILADFERSYGEFVLLQPTLSGVNWLVWTGPILALVLGGVVVAFTLRRSRKPAAAAVVAPPSRGALPDDPRLAAAVLRVRELAYGWKGGVPPGVSQ